MTNLLDPTIKKGIRSEYHLRIISITLFLISLCVIAASVLLLPAYLNTRAESKSLTYQIDALKQSGSSVMDPETQEESVLLTNRIQALQAYPETAIKRHIEYLSVLQTLPNELNYQRFDFKPTNVDVKADEISDTFSKLVVTGKARDRSDLASAVQSLQVVDWINSVEYPLSDLSRSNDIEFSMVISYDAALIPNVINYNSFITVDSGSQENEVINEEN